MAAALPVVAETARPFIEAEVKEYKEDPMLWVFNKATQIGSIMAILGIAMWAAAKPLLAYATAARNDMEDRLGLPRSSLPNAPPPTPPPTPPLLGAFVKVASDLSVLDNTNAATVVGQLNATLADLASFQHLADASTPQTVNDNPSGGPVGGTPGTCPDGSTQVYNGTIYMCVLTSHLTDYTSSGWTAVPNVPPPPPTIQWVPTQTPPDDVDSHILNIQNQLGEAVTLLSNPVSGAWLTSQIAIAAATQELNSIADVYGWPEPFQKIPNGNPSWYSGLVWVGVNAYTAYGYVLAAGSPIVAAGVSFFGPIAQDIQTVAGDIAGAIVFVSHAVMNFPYLFWDAFAYGVSWSAGSVFQLLGPFFTEVGIGLVIGGAVARMFWIKVRPKLASRLELYGEARTARFWNWLDGTLGTRAKIGQVQQAKAMDTAVEKAITHPVVTPPVIEAVPATEAERTKPEEVGGAVSLTEGAPPPDRGPGAAPGSVPPAEPTPPFPEDVGPAPTPPDASASPVLNPDVRQETEPRPTNAAEPPERPVPTPTAETEEFLGEHESRAPSVAELKAQEANRLASMPPTYRQRKEEREHEEAERLIQMGEAWA